jgi:hypothetical protein
MQQPTNSYILNCKPGPLSFVIGDWNDSKGFYAAVPCHKGLAIVNQGNVIKICRNTSSARKYIEKHQKRRK